MDLREAVSSNLGSSLLCVYENRFVSTDNATADREQVCFVFGDGVLQFRCAADGWCIELSQPEPPTLGERVEMGEFGSLEWVDLGSSKRFRRLIGEKLTGASIVISAGKPIGALLQFADREVKVLNWGDELILLDSDEEIGTDGEFELVYHRVS